MKKFLSIAFLLLLNFSALKAQTPDLNLTVTQNDRVVGGFIRVKVQIRELAPGGFTLGPSNIRIRYKMAGLANPTISSNFLPTFQSITLTNNLNQPTGFNRLSVNLNCINIFGCPGVFVGSNFVDLVELQFEILSLNETLDFDILINDGGFGNTVLKEFPDLNYYGGTTMDQIIWNGTSWTGGNGSDGAPDATDAVKQIIVQSGTAVLEGDVEAEYFQIAPGAKLEVAPGGSLRPFVQDGSVGYSVPNVDAFLLDADATGYSQYLGPTVPGTIRQYIANDAGWRNIAIPVANPSGFSFGSAQVNLNSSATSYHAAPSIPDECGNFGNSIANANVYTFTGATGSAQPHEWFGPNALSGGTLGYSMFFGGGNFNFPDGFVEVKGNFFATSQTYSYAHAAPHASGATGASQSNYDPAAAGCATPGEATAALRHANWDGWALVANPFPCNLDVAGFVADNTDIGPSNFSLSAATVRVWDRSSNEYVTKNATDASIPPMQAFWIKSGADGDNFTVDFNPSRRVIRTEAFLKTQNQDPYVKLIATNTATNQENAIHLQFDPMATKGYDASTDAYVLSQPGNTVPQLAFVNFYQSATNGVNILAPLDYNTVPMISGLDNYPLIFWARTSGNFEFSLDQDLLEPGWEVYIEDLAIAPGVHHNITNAPYAFSYTRLEDPKRFVMHFTPTTIGLDQIDNRGKVFAYGNVTGVNVGFNNLSGQVVNIEISNEIGQVLHKAMNVSTDQHYTYVPTRTVGLYIVTVTRENGVTESFKVMR